MILWTTTDPPDELAQFILPKAVILDFDGVIVNSQVAHTVAWQHAFRELTGKHLPAHILDSIVGRSSLWISRNLSKHLNDTISTDILISKKNDALIKRIGNIDLIPGARPFIDRLNHHRIPWGIASNSYKQYILKAIAFHHLSTHVVHGIEDYKKPKPSPEPFLICARSLGISPAYHNEIIVIEDSPLGIRAAKKAGMIPVGIAPNETQFAALKQEGAKAVYKDLRSLIDSQN